MATVSNSTMTSNTMNTKQITVVMLLFAGALICLIVLLSYIRLPRLRKFPSSLVWFEFLGIFIACMTLSGAMWWGFSLDPPQTACTIQAFFVTYGNICGGFWVTLVGLNLYGQIVLNHTRTKLFAYFKLYLFIGFVLPIPFSIATVAVGDIGMMSIWCWIKTPKYLRIVSLYGVVLPASLFSLFLYAHLVYTIYSHSRKMSKRAKKKSSTYKGIGNASLMRLLAMGVVYGFAFSVASVGRIGDYIRDKPDTSKVGLPEIGAVMMGLGFPIVYISGYAKKIISGRQSTMGSRTTQTSKSGGISKQLSHSGSFSSINKKKSLKMKQLSGTRSGSSAVIIDTHKDSTVGKKNMC